MIFTFKYSSIMQYDNKSLRLTLQHICFLAMERKAKHVGVLCFYFRECVNFLYSPWGRRDRDRMVVGLTTLYAINAYHN
jgi:hypothetical protein